VTAGLQDSHQVVINAGLSAGERVVTDGLDRLTEGAQVEVVAPQSTALKSSRAAQPAKGASE
ncbi:MAG TPA: multidrug transporter subunit MdtA, partial [Pantoea sp.]|nr:multidrug transporter subunit MdtA [Pantoea sp.]